MSSKGKSTDRTGGKEQANATKTCFVIGPISDVEGYDVGHFALVYAHLIKPACALAGYDAVRSDDGRGANDIVIGILRKILTSDIVLCDLSSKNPNVMYELGIRHAFNKPVVLIKDHKTARVFDIQGLRTYEYDENLRVDRVQKDIQQVSEALHATATASKDDVNSMLQLLGVRAAEISEPIELSPGDKLIMSSIKQLGDRVDALRAIPQYLPMNYSLPATFPNMSFDASRYINTLPEEVDHVVSELWTSSSRDDLLGKPILLDGVKLGFVAELNPAKGELTVMDSNSNSKSMSVHDARFRRLIARY
jgi:hypothetical protein